MSNTRVITVSGVVGAGKTTFIKAMAEGLGLTAFFENVDGNELLGMMYHDPERWALTLQVSFLREKYVQMQEAAKLGKAIVERTIFEDKIFTGTHRAQGRLTDVEWGVYLGMYEHFTTHAPRPDLMIFLDVPDELALKRIKHRNRAFEIGDMQTKMFLEQNAIYRQWVEEYDGPKIIVDNASFDYIYNDSHRNQMINYLKRFLEDGSY